MFANSAFVVFGAFEPSHDYTICRQESIYLIIVVVVLGFYVSPTAKVIRRRDLGLKSHPKDWRSRGSNSHPWIRMQEA